MSEAESGFGESASQFKSTRDFPSCSTYSTFPQMLDDTKGSTIGPSLAPLSFTSRCIKRSYNDSGTVVCAHQKGTVYMYICHCTWYILYFIVLNLITWYIILLQFARALAITI